MSLLKKENWPISLMLMIFVPNIYIVLVAYTLGVMDKNAWYAKWYYWFFGIICLFFPALIMFVIFEIEMLVKSCQKLNVPGYELYTIPYIWILSLIIPIVGWILFIVFMIYLELCFIIAIIKGEGEKICQKIQH